MWGYWNDTNDIHTVSINFHITGNQMCYNFVRGTVDNLKYMYTNQIVSTYWVSSAQCIPNLHCYIVQNDVKCIIIMKSFYVVPWVVPPEVLVIDTIRAFRIGLKNYSMFQMSQKRYIFTVSSTLSSCDRLNLWLN